MYLVPEISDPLCGVIVWGTTGLVAWLALAGAVGVGLRALGGSGRREVAVQPPRSRHAGERVPAAPGAATRPSVAVLNAPASHRPEPVIPRMSA